MEDQPGLVIVVSVLLLFGSIFFVASEYALVSSRRSRLEGAAKRGDRGAKRVLSALDEVGKLVATTQIAITMVGIGVGSVTEPSVTKLLSGLFGVNVPKALSLALSYLAITYFMVVLGELLPKYLALQHPESVAKLTTGPTQVLARILSPLVWLAQTSASFLLRLFGIKPETTNDFQREELLMLVRAGQAGGGIERGHADFITRTLKLDALTAKDIMIHRLDMMWLDVQTPSDEIVSKLATIPHSRIPVCKGDIDDLIGVVYVHDVIKNLNQPKFDLRKILRPAITIPENLTLDRIVLRMREDRSQILIVMDEYGGTSGLITLEDVVEEVFGELEDTLESERPPVEVHGGGRVTARADVRFDELVGRLGLELHDEPATETLAEMIVEATGRVPRIGDSVETPVGLMRVDNMARRRITRVSLKLKDGLAEVDPGS